MNSAEDWIFNDQVTWNRPIFYNCVDFLLWVGFAMWIVLKPSTNEDLHFSFFILYRNARAPTRTNDESSSSLNELKSNRTLKTDSILKRQKSHDFNFSGSWRCSEMYNRELKLPKKVYMKSYSASQSSIHDEIFRNLNAFGSKIQSITDFQFIFLSHSLHQLLYCNYFIHSVPTSKCAQWNNLVPYINEKVKLN